MEELMNVTLEAVLTILVILVGALGTWISPQIKLKLKSWIDKDNSGTIEKIVKYGVELAERELTGEAGEDKFNRALIYATDMLNRYGIYVTYEFLQGVIENAHSQMELEQKTIEE